MNINFDDLVAPNTAFHKMYGKIYLSETQYNVLKSYGFAVDKYHSVSELIYDIEQYLNEDGSDFEDLESVSRELAEYNYYNNTNK